jgi:RHH-type rel operon transcriptional repressor/antitoxin RelB
MLTIDLPEDIHARLEALATSTGKTKEALAAEVVSYYLEDLEELVIAEERLRDFDAGKVKTIPLEEVERRLGLAENPGTCIKWDPSHAYLLMKQSEAISLLPNIKPRKAKCVLDEINYFFFHEYLESGYSEDEKGYSSFEMNGLSITMGEFKSAVISAPTTWGEETNYVTPEGAALLLRMYKSGCFELDKKREGVGDASKLEAYAASGETLLRQYAQDQDLAAQKKAQELRWKEHPEELPEDKFTPSLLNDIMWHHGVKGMHVSMEIGGITVTKSVSRHTSNSGKTQDNTVVFRWTGSDGVDHEEFLKKSYFENNRRNDADRNWGLPE